MQFPVTTSLAHAAYQKIIAMIFDGQLRSGDVLQEAALGTMFGMSRTPVREALKQLESEGLARADGRVKRVRAVTARDVEEIFFLRLALEPFAARSAVRLPPAQLDTMEHRINTLMDSPMANAEVQRQTDQDFHQIIAREHGNQAILAIIAHLQRQTCVFDHAQVPERFRAGCREHLGILDAARSGNAAAVEGAVRQHLEHARDAVLRRLGQLETASHQPEVMR